ncbi:hypothetical protein ACLOJK_000896 [Asimina triloba]
MGYSDGDRLSEEDQSWVLDNVFQYHPEKTSKISEEIDYIMDRSLSIDRLINIQTTLAADAFLLFPQMVTGQISPLSSVLRIMSGRSFLNAQKHSTRSTLAKDVALREQVSQLNSFGPKQLVEKNYAPSNCSLLNHIRKLKWLTNVKRCGRGREGNDEIVRD